MDLSKLSMAELKDLLGKALKEEKNRTKSDLEAARNEIFAIAQRLNLRWSSNFGHNDRFTFCHFLFVDRGWQIAQC